jgi:hypothetical protein
LHRTEALSNMPLHSAKGHCEKSSLQLHLGAAATALILIG